MRMERAGLKHEVKRQMACKPGSVPLRRGDGHSSGTPVAGRLARPTRTAMRKRAGLDCDRPAIPTWSCSRWGLPCRPCCRKRGALLPHHFTLAARPEGRRRCRFCGTFPGVAPAGRYPAPCFRGARTFLAPSCDERGHPAIWQARLRVATAAEVKRAGDAARRSAARFVIGHGRPFSGAEMALERAGLRRVRSSGAASREDHSR